MLHGVEEVVLTDSQHQRPARSWGWGMLLISDQLNDVVRVSQQRCSPFASVKRMSEGSLLGAHLLAVGLSAFAVPSCEDGKSALLSFPHLCRFFLTVQRDVFYDLL